MKEAARIVFGQGNSEEDCERDHVEEIAADEGETPPEEVHYDHGQTAADEDSHIMDEIRLQETETRQLLHADHYCLRSQMENRPENS